MKGKSKTNVSPAGKTGPVARIIADHPAALVAVGYALIVIAMCGMFTFSSGMPYETSFPYMSETSPTIWHGFLYWNDSLRIHTNTFYHFAYLLSAIFGIIGSFAPYQIIYAVLWWARGFLVYLILRRLLPGYPLFCFAIGALVLVHASDGALQWVGQLNQFGFIFWMLLALYFYVANIQRGGIRQTLLYILLATFFQYMCLWSYESPLPVILAVPLLLMPLYRPSCRRRLAICVGWYITPIIYLILTIRRYQSTSNVYQVSVVRNSWSPYSLLSDWSFNVRSSVAVWSWNRIPSDLPHWQVALLAALAAATFIVWATFVLRRYSKKGEVRVLPEVRRLWIVFFTGAIILILSFPVYLVLSAARSLWRTQILSGIGAAMVLGSTIALAAAIIRREALRAMAFWGITAAVVFLGAYSAIERGGYHRMRWRNHKHAMAEVIRAAPEVEPATMFVLVNVPKRADPFYISQWFDMALRLAYPGTAVAGTYFYQDHTPAGSANLVLDSTGWHWNHTFLEPLVTNAGVGQTIVIEYNTNGPGRVLRTLPSYVCRGVCSAQSYDPRARIIGSVPSPRAVRRYGPF